MVAVMAESPAAMLRWLLSLFAFFFLIDIVLAALLSMRV
jgi:hypothetical protein